MPKPASPFAGKKLTEGTPLSESGLDQRLFSRTTPPVVVPKPKVPEIRKQARNLETLQPTKEATLEPRNQGTLAKMVGDEASFDLNSLPYKNDTFSFTTEELEAIEDIKLELRRRLDLPATKNDIVRCAVHSLVEDYRRHGPESLVVRRIRKKRGR
jgi:hypothetical protein